MPECNRILGQGIFNTVIIDASRTLSDNLFTWLSSSSFSTVKSMIDGGLKIALPVEGVPLDLGVSITEDSFNQWKSQISQGGARAFTEQETMNIVSKNVDQGIVNAWLECIREKSAQEQTGLLVWSDGPTDDGVVVVTARYLPVSIDDYPPTINPNGFQITGGTTSYPLIDGSEIPLAGISVLIQRQEDSEIVVVLNTSKGTETIVIPPPPIKQSDLQFVVQVVDDAQPGTTTKHYTLQMSGRSRAIQEINRVDYKANGFNYRGGGADRQPTSFTRLFSSSNPANQFQISFSEFQPITSIIAHVTLSSTQLCSI